MLSWKYVFDFFLAFSIHDIKKSLCVEDEQKTHKNTFFEEKNREKKE